MPRNGSGVFSAPAGTTATPNTPIESAKYNAFVADLTNDLNLARPIVAGGTGATTKSGAQQALDLEPGVDIQAYNAKLAALAALTLAADKLIYATGSDTLATSDLTAFARTLLEANDLAAVWTLLYLGNLAGKSKISVPGDIDATGTADSTTRLAGDGTWQPDLATAIAEGAAGAPRIEDAALDATATSGGATWIGNRYALLGHADIGTVIMAARTGTSAHSPGDVVAGSNLLYSNGAAAGASGNPPGTWVCLGLVQTGAAAGGNKTVVWRRVS